MADLPTTRPSLLIRIRDLQDRDAWQQFVCIYAPVVYQYARKRGLQDADAADLTQETLAAVTAGVGRLRYDPERGAFRGWLFTVAHHKLYDFQVRRQRTAASGDSRVQEFLEQQPAPAEDAALWDQEYEQQLLAWAADKVRDQFRDSTWQAFWLTAVEGHTAQHAAETLGLTVAAVYQAKSRVIAKLKEQVQEIEGDPFAGRNETNHDAATDMP